MIPIEDRLEERETRRAERFWDAVDDMVEAVGWDFLMEQLAQARKESEAATPAEETK